MKKIIFRIFILVSTIVSSAHVYAVSQQDSNNCMATTGQFCERTGSCSIQGADWYQYVTIDKSDIFDTQGWTGVCDMVHVALVQGKCSPPQSTTDITVNLSATTFATIPEIVGPLNCDAEVTADGDVAPLGAPDGIVNTADLLIMLRIALGVISPDSVTLVRGDIYPDGEPDGVINTSDLIRMYPLVTAP